jgi:hypothetical protein
MRDRYMVSRYCSDYVWRTLQFCYGTMKCNNTIQYPLGAGTPPGRSQQANTDPWDIKHIAYNVVSGPYSIHIYIIQRAVATDIKNNAVVSI